jgi:hypothetical protein
MVLVRGDDFGVCRYRGCEPAAPSVIGTIRVLRACLSATRHATWTAALVVALAPLAILPVVQSRAQAAPTTPTIRIDSSLTLVDVITENKRIGLRTRELLTDLKREDFRILDNGHEMPIESFDIGVEHATRPLHCG